MRVASEQRPTTVITPRRGWFRLGISELWQYRELGLFLVWRDIKVRYKQTVVGASWAIVSPIVLMVVFTVVFGRIRGDVRGRRRRADLVLLQRSCRGGTSRRRSTPQRTASSAPGT